MKSDRIRVLNCVHRSDFGGAHRRIVWVNDLLKIKNVNTIVLFPSDKHVVFEKFLTHNKVQYERTFLPAIRKSFIHLLLFILMLPISVILVVIIIHKNEIQIVHANGATNLQPVLAALLMQKGLVWHWNDTLTPKWFVKVICKLLVIKSVIFTAATPGILSYYGIENIPCEIIPAPSPECGSIDASVSKMLRDKLNLKPKEKIIGFVSHIIAAKGVQEFVQAAIIVLQQDPALHAVLVGGTFPRHKPFAEAIRSLVKENLLQCRIHFLGHQDNVVDFMHAFDVFVFPSHSEACPITILQAMQAGKPILATRVGDIPNMLTGTGLSLVEPMDTNALVRGIQELLSLTDETKAKSAIKMRSTLHKHYSLRRVVDLHYKVYSHIVMYGCD